MKVDRAEVEALAEGLRTTDPALAYAALPERLRNAYTQQQFEQQVAKSENRIEKAEIDRRLMYRGWQDIPMENLSAFIQRHQLWRYALAPLEEETSQ